MFPDYRCWFETDSAEININYRGGVQQLPLLLFAKLKKNKRPYNTNRSAVATG